MPDLAVTIDVNVPADHAWNALTDWAHQGDWMLATRVRATTGNGHGTASVIEARTGLGPLSFLDTMVITTWDPPRRCLVNHTGHVIRGTGGFEITTLADDRCRVLWFERIDVPFAAVGRAGWTLIRPAVRWGVAASLRRFKQGLETHPTG